VLGLMVGVGFAWLRQLLDRHVQSSAELDDLVDVPVLGAIPLRRGASHDDPVIREAYDLLRANLAFLGVESPCRVVTVTSHESGEGKTSVAEGLARASARAGARTVLVDGDVRTRELSHRLGYDVNTGLTDLVAGARDGAAVANGNGSGGGEARGSRRVRVDTNLALLPAGSQPPNPASLLASPSVEGVLDAAARGADLVVIDTPPATDLADASLIASHSDGAIVVVRAGKTSKQAVRSTIASLETARVRPLGVVVLEPRSIDSAYYPARERRRARGGRTPARV
jgi:capsular exopolysaccharide synthesis family protein